MRRLLLFFFIITTITTSSQPFYGRTKGRQPYLNYGLGEDRLGGAKMGFLDSNVLVKVVDSNRGDYKVQLSAQHAAWLPKNAFRRDDSVKIQPYYLTGSWRVWATVCTIG